jgi:hypothetical protein
VVILNSEITNKKSTPKAKHMTNKKDTCLQYEKASTKKAVSPCSISAGNMHVEKIKIFSDLYMSVNDHESTVSIDIGVTNKL